MSQTNAIILRIKAWDEMAEQFQPEGPSVWGGKTILEIG